jgi:hypothetical protein
MLLLGEFEYLLRKTVYRVSSFPGEWGWLLAAEPAALTCHRQIERFDSGLDRVLDSPNLEDVSTPVVLSAGEYGGVYG